MYILGINMWFTKLIKQFFFWVDKIVFNFISEVYDLMIVIARTSPLRQSDIIEMADRIYKLLAVFMIFKVTLSLITYIVNPDDFSDKSKGISKLGANVVISLSLLVLTPYIFSYAFELQTIILEDNSLLTLVFGSSGETNYYSTAGQKMAYTTMSAFVTPNVSMAVESNGNSYNLSSCVNITMNKKFNDECYESLKNAGMSTNILNNYKAGVENESLGLFFRDELILETANDDFIMDYRFIFSTVVGVIVILLLLTFCMDVAVRSIKLAFLQLIAPIPILSYIDPKSSKDGLFKKWYQMCFKTYLSLFLRLLALYFAVYIISKVSGDLVDVVDGSTVTNGYVKIFIIIGALMFAKQLPKILEGLGIKLDGDGKFTLNPLKKFQEGAVGGKKILGAGKGVAAGALVGTAGMFSGAGLGRGVSAMYGGFKSGLQGKKFGEIRKDQVNKNAEMRRAISSGSSFLGRRKAQLSGYFGTPGTLGEIEHDKIKTQNKIDQLNARKKIVKDQIAPKNTVIANQQAVKSSVENMESFTTGLIESGKAGTYSTKWKQLGTDFEYLKNNIGKTSEYTITNAEDKEIVKKGDKITNEIANKLSGEQSKYSKKIGREKVMDELFNGLSKESKDGQVGLGDLNEFKAKQRSYEEDVRTLNDSIKEYSRTASPDDIRIQEIEKMKTFQEIHQQAADLSILSTDVKTSIKKQEADIKKIETEVESEQIKIEEYNAQEKKAKSNVEAVHSTQGGPAFPDDIIPSDYTVGRRSGGPGSGRGPSGPFGGPHGGPHGN